MSQDQWTTVDRYVTDLFVPPDLALDAARAGLADVVELRLGKALDTLPQLAAEGQGPFDLVFIDADKPNTSAYFEWALQLTRRGSLIITDNVVRHGAVIDVASDDANVQGVRRFNAALAAEPRVSATVIQTVGSKGHDGLAIALVTGDSHTLKMSHQQGTKDVKNA